MPNVVSIKPLTAPHPEEQYLGLLADILNNGARRDDRTGTGTLGVFGRQIRFDLAQGFPMLTTKKLHLKSIVLELLWFLRGETNVRWLQERGVKIWDEWADENGVPALSAQRRHLPRRAVQHRLLRPADDDDGQGHRL